MDATATIDWTSPVLACAPLLDTEARRRLDRLELWSMRVVLLAGAVALGCVAVAAMVLAWG